MTKPIDILSMPGGDLVVRGGDLALGDATQVHTHDIVVAAKGCLKWSPTLGVGAKDFINDNNLAGLKGAIRRELGRDGQTVTSLTVGKDAAISIESFYE